MSAGSFREILVSIGFFDFTCCPLDGVGIITAGWPICPGIAIPGCASMALGLLLREGTFASVTSTLVSASPHRLRLLLLRSSLLSSFDWSARHAIGRNQLIIDRLIISTIRNIVNCIQDYIPSFTVWSCMLLRLIHLLSVAKSLLGTVEIRAAVLLILIRLLGA